MTLKCVFPAQTSLHRAMPDISASLVQKHLRLFLFRAELRIPPLPHPTRTTSEFLLSGTSPTPIQKYIFLNTSPSLLLNSPQILSRWPLKRLLTLTTSLVGLQVLTMVQTIVMLTQCRDGSLCSVCLHLLSSPSGQFTKLQPGGSSKSANQIMSPLPETLHSYPFLSIQRPKSSKRLSLYEPHFLPLSPEL